MTIVKMWFSDLAETWSFLDIFGKKRNFKNFSPARLSTVVGAAVSPPKYDILEKPPFTVNVIKNCVGSG